MQSISTRSTFEIYRDWNSRKGELEHISTTFDYFGLISPACSTKDTVRKGFKLHARNRCWKATTNQSMLKFEAMQLIDLR